MLKLASILIISLCYFALYLVGIIKHIRLDEPSFWFVLFLILGFVFMPQKKKLTGLKVLMLLFSCTLGLVVADLALRVFMRQKVYYRPEEFLIQRWPKLSQSVRLKPNANVNMIGFGDLAAMNGKKEFQDRRPMVFITDERGFRNDPKICQAPVDLILLGDSFGIGSGTTQDKTWGHFLNTKHQIPSYNLAITGDNPEMGYLNLAVEIDELKTHKDTTVITALFTGNDLEDANPPADINNLRWSSPRKERKLTLKAFRNRSALRKFSYQFFLHKHINEDMKAIPFLNEKPMLFLTRYIQVSGKDKTELEKHPRYENLKNTLLALKKLTDKKGVRYKVMVVPTKNEVYEWMIKDEKPWSTPAKHSEFFKMAKALGASMGIDVVDLKPYLVKKSKETYERLKEPLYWYDDTHWNEAGNEAVAAFVHIWHKTGIAPNQEI